MFVGRLASYHAGRTPNALAVIDGEREITYGAMNQRVNRLANALAGIGLRANDHAGILLRNQLEFIETYLALAKLGVTAVTLNWRLASEELAYAMNDSESRAVIYNTEFSPKLDACLGKLEHTHYFISVGEPEMSGHVEYEAFLERGSDVEPSELALRQDQAQMIMYSSGTTGFPKGALLSHSNLFWHSWNIHMYHDTRPSDRCLCVLPLYHTASLNISVIPHLHIGAAVVMQRSFDPELTVRLLSEQCCTSTIILPQMWREVSDVPLERYKFNLKEMITGGGPTPPETVQRLMKATGAGYSLIMGMTEVGPQANFLAPEDVIRKNGTVGKPTMCIGVRIVDEDMQDVPTGTVGEMLFRGPTVFSGYWKKESANRESFTDGWFHSGDLVFRDDEGFITIVDRKKDMIRSGGENIFSLEIERVLNQHPAILESAVVGVPDERWGESVKAFVVLKQGQSVSVDGITEWCRQHLASYKKPRFIRFIDHLPKNSMGRVLKQELRRLDDADSS